MKLRLAIAMSAISLHASSASVLPYTGDDDAIDPTLKSHLEHTTLIRRFWDDDLASDASWLKYTLKGGTLMCGLEADDQTAGRQIYDTRSPPSAASRWTGQELRDWYWHETAPSNSGCDFDGFWKFGATVRALGLSTDEACNVCWKVVHYDPELRDERGAKVPKVMQRYEVEGISMRATGAELEFIVNMNGGAIFGTYLDSPKFAARTLWHSNTCDPNPSALPSLYALSDIFWAYWTRSNPNIRNINYFFMLGISNDITTSLIARCLRNAGATLSEWPGTSFDADSEEGHALIGSPNGAAFAFFLMQHKAQLGQKVITRVTVLRPETEDDNDFVDASLLFHVGDGPPLPPADPVRRKSREEKVEKGNEGFVHSHVFEL